MFSSSSASKNPNRFFSGEHSNLSWSQDQLETMKNMLNSERIKFLFGSYDVEILFQMDNKRISNLHSNNIMRTCAVVNFSQSLPNWLEVPHNKIINGGSLGQTIKENGLKLFKEDVFIGSTILPEPVRKKMEINQSVGAVHFYQLFVENPKSSERVLYCKITEAHSPVYLSVEDLLYLCPSYNKDLPCNTYSTQNYLQDLNIVEEFMVGQKIKFN